ncbi:MAG: 50S ribosomal protein L31 [Candidatus Portnoybacteria bacterium]|nr:50S ribosomal protein L31 [Candidatus Portnoybacteria bacterium]
MKKDIHPSSYPNATVKCACGASFTISSTVPHMEVDICSNCHPFYTGAKKLVDVAGRVEKFQARLKKTEQIKARDTKGKVRNK